MLERTRRDGGPALGELKTPTSKRTMVMPSAAAGALKALRAQQAGERLRLGAAYRDTGLVFCRPDGSPEGVKAVGKRFKRRCANAGIGDDWHAHEMRHTFTSVLSDHGVNVEDIADALGHADSNVTRAVYRHQITDTVTRAAAAMDQIFGAGSAS